MSSVFLRVLDASFSGSVVILVILLLRLVLKKAPKSMLCLLWLLAGLRLMVPFEIESSFSLQPSYEPASQIRWEQPEQEVYTPAATVEPVGIAPAATAPAVQQPVPQPTQEKKVDMTEAVPYVWLAGMIGMLLYTFLSYLRLQRKVCTAVRAADGCWETEQIDTAFVLGFLNPQIYLPMRLSPVSRAFIVSHERTHMDRYDHWWKLLGYLVVTVHWFNPLVWLAYGLLCRDMEMACDEQVVRHMDADQRKAYSSALLSCAGKHRAISACPVAFGEVSVKQRILQVLHYRKPGFWITLLALIALVFVLVCFMTSPNGIVFELETDEIVSIFVQNGTNGEQYYFETAEEREMVVRMLNDLRYDYKVPDLRPAMGGWSYRIVVNTDEDNYSCLVGDKAILLNDVFYCFLEDNPTLMLLMEYADSDWATDNWDFRGRCYEVITGFQSQDSYHVTVEENYHCAHMQDTARTTDYWRMRSEWLIVEEYAGQKVKTVETGGHRYCTDANGSWVLDETSQGWKAPSFYEFWWNGGSIDNHSHGQEGSIRYVTVQVNEPLEMDGATIPFYFLTFRFDLEWTPISVTQTASWTVDGQEESMEITMYLHTHDDVAVQKEIENHYLQALEDLREDGTVVQKPLTNGDADLIEKCRTVLEAMGQLPYYAIQEDTSYIPKGELGTHREMYWKYNDDWVHEFYDEGDEPYMQRFYSDGYFYEKTDGQWSAGIESDGFLTPVFLMEWGAGGYDWEPTVYEHTLTEDSEIITLEIAESFWLTFEFDEADVLRAVSFSEYSDLLTGGEVLMTTRSYLYTAVQEEIRQKIEEVRAMIP